MIEHSSTPRFTTADIFLLFCAFVIVLAGPFNTVLPIRPQASALSYEKKTMGYIRWRAELRVFVHLDC